MITLSREVRWHSWWNSAKSTYITSSPQNQCSSLILTPTQKSPPVDVCMYHLFSRYICVPRSDKAWGLYRLWPSTNFFLPNINLRRTLNVSITKHLVKVETSLINKFTKVIKSTSGGMFAWCINPKFEPYSLPTTSRGTDWCDCCLSCATPFLARFFFCAASIDLVRVRS